MIFTVVLYGCETWSVTLREEHRLRVFSVRLLRKIYEPKWDDVTGEYRRLHKEELYALYSSPDSDQIKKNEMGGSCGTYGGQEVAYRLWWET